VILQTEHWVLNHRVDTALPGYLMLGVRIPTNDLSLLGPEALAQLGTLLAGAQKALTAILKPEHFYIGRFGHAGHGLSCERCRSEPLCVTEVVVDLINILASDPSAEVRHKTVILLSRFAGRDARAGEAIAVLLSRIPTLQFGTWRLVSWKIVSRYISVENARCVQFGASGDGIRRPLSDDALLLALRALIDEDGLRV
jgi:hypothetical protein